ncbi:MAG: hypothetical protein HYY50_02270 [Candidatus Kerfeldbacteria bacterium]|nr:hypothetical protein [Candidatus Kerfeldbacteria bacterium]
MADTPPTYRRWLNRQVVRQAAEWQAQKLGKSDVDEEALVRGYIVVVPRHLRDGIEEVLTDHNYDLLYFRPVFDEPTFRDHLSSRTPPSTNRP